MRTVDQHDVPQDRLEAESRRFASNWDTHNHEADLDEITLLKGGRFGRSYTGFSTGMSLEWVVQKCQYSPRIAFRDKRSRIVVIHHIVFSANQVLTSNSFQKTLRVLIGVVIDVYGSSDDI